MGRVDHHYDRHAQIDTKRVAVEEREEAHRHQHETTRRKTYIHRIKLTVFQQPDIPVSSTIFITVCILSAARASATEYNAFGVLRRIRSRAASALRRPLLANPNLVRNPNMVFRKYLPLYGYHQIVVTNGTY